MLFSLTDNHREQIWQGVPTPQPQVPYIVDPVEDNEFTVVAHVVVGGIDVGGTLYEIDGVWRVQAIDSDDHPEVQSAVFEVIVDRRYNPEDVRQAVIKLLSNLYAQI